MLAIETKRIQRKFGAALTVLALLSACAGTEDDNPSPVFTGADSSVNVGSNTGAPGGGAVATPGGGTAGVTNPTGGGTPGAGGGTPGAGGGTPGAGGGTPGAGGGTPGAGGGTPGAGGGMDGGVAMGTDGGMVLPGDAASDTSVTPSDGGATGGGDATVDAAPPPRMDLGKGDGKDVVLIGDSWMSNTLQLEGTGGGISTSLKNLTKQPYRNYAVQGVMLLSDNALFGPAIPTQWDDAVKANPNIKTVVMTAGGNDIIQGPSDLQDSCKVGGDLCQTTLTKIGQTLGNLWKKMSAAGVQDIIYILYAKSANEGRLKDPDLNNQQMQLLCSKVPPPARCFTINTDDLVKGDLAIDGIHPVSAANDRVAKAISDLMVAKGIRR